MKDNYIVIGGKKAELTEEQLKALGIVEEKKSPFERAKKEDVFYYIGISGKVCTSVEGKSLPENLAYEAANYCTDKALMEQRALHEVLNRLLWRFTYENGWSEDRWEETSIKYKVCYDVAKKELIIECNNAFKESCVYFKNKETAERAIDEVIKPFIKKHPMFVW